MLSLLTELALQHAATLFGTGRLLSTVLTATRCMWSYGRKLVTGRLGGIPRRCSRAAGLAENAPCLAIDGSERQWRMLCQMTQDTVVAFRAPTGFSADPLTDLLRQGARQLIAQAVEAELSTFLSAHADQTDAAGRRRLVRHGHLPERFKPGSARCR